MQAKRLAPFPPRRYRSDKSAVRLRLTSFVCSVFFHLRSIAVASLPVHVFSLAERAYRTLRRAQTTQTEVPLAQVIVLSGQSGAGKVSVKM